MVTKVFLLSSFADPADDTHWASPYHALRRAFGEQRSANSVLVDSPVDADLILICPRARNPVFPTEIFRDGIAWKYRHKCVVVSTDDNPTMTHKGFYTSKRASATRSPWLKGGFYPLVAYALPEAPFPLDADFRHLFSFRGSFATHPVRRRIGMLADAASPEEALRFLVVDTSQRTAGDSQIFNRDYVASLRDSKFILCPRGMCPSSVRLFETMKSGRVPVVISDEWTPPPEVPWKRFVISIAEKDVASIPRILGQEESGFLERARTAQQAWTDYFCAQALPETVSRWGMSLLDQARHETQLLTHFTALWAQVFRWRFVRRGVLSQMRQILTGAAAD
jgi:hypothetical protein